MDNKPFKFTHNKQFEYLYTTMEENLHIARGNALSSPGQDDLNDFWENLADILNKIGPLLRTASGWLKIWNDHKRLILKKVQYNNLPVSEKGPRQFFILTHLEKRVAQILYPNIFNLSPPSTAAKKLPPTSSAGFHAAQYRIKVKASAENMESLPPEIPKQARATILQIQDQTYRYLKKMAEFEEQRLKIEKAELEEKIRFREELATLVNLVKNSVCVDINP